MKTESNKVAIPHPDGSTTLFGPGYTSAENREQRPGAFTEKELLNFIESLPLPLKPDSLNIIGFGGHSVALRIGLEGSNNTSIVGVLRYVDTTSGLPELPTSDLIQTTFAEYCLPEWTVALSDAEGNRMSLKFAPEIYGATLKDLSPLHLLSNPKALKQFGEFCLKTMELFFQEKKLPDLVGHNQKGLSFFPIFTSNIMIEYGTNNLRLVDTDDMNTNNVAAVSLKRKTALYARVAGIFATSLMAKSIEKLTHPTQNEQNHSPEIDKEFLAGVQDVVTTLEELGLDYRIVGSLALAAHLESKGVVYQLSSRRTDGTSRDVDVIILTKDVNLINKSKDIFKKKRADNPHYPEVSMTTPALPKATKKTILQKLLPRLTSELSFVQGTDDLTQNYGNLTLALNQEELAPQLISYQGVSFKTLAPETLFGLALTRNGVIKFKDLAKYELFCETFSVKPNTKYVDFARVMRTEHRAEYRNFLTRQWLSILTHAIFDGSLTQR